MYVISNAMIEQAEIVQKDRWERGPLELVFCPEPKGIREQVHINSWNRHHRGGIIREGGETRTVERLIPSVARSQNPNIFIVPTQDDYSQLHEMLASVVPNVVLKRFGIEKRRASLWLWPVSGHDEKREGYAPAAEAAFKEFIWPKITGERGLRKDYAASSPFQLLAADTRFWMHRLYRIALDRADDLGPTDHEDDDWESLETLWNKMKPTIPPDLLPSIELTRPYFGGYLWDPSDQRECNSVVEEMIHGAGVMDSLEPVLEVLWGHRTHDDFSERYSWVKEDFERSFYSKRAKTKVTLVETTDHAPVWSSIESTGYENVLFRDILAAFHPRERRIIIALRHGMTVTDISKSLGLRGHAAISRRLKEIKKRLRPMLSSTN